VAGIQLPHLEAFMRPMLRRLPSQSSTAWQSVITSAGSGRTQLAVAKGLVTPEELEARWLP